MASVRTRLLALGLGALCASPIVAWYVGTRALEAKSLDATLAASENLVGGTTRSLARENERAGRWRYFLAEDDARAMFGAFHAQLVYDPDLYFVFPANHAVTRRLSEHPDGEFIVRTNDIGLHEDEPLGAGPFDLRVLVTGDSHVAGLCNNSEAFVDRLEKSLALERPDQRVDVINASGGGYSLYNYLGALRKFADAEIDVFVVTIYGGNDFSGLVHTYRLFEGLGPMRMTPEIGERLARGRQEHPMAMAQVVGSSVLFAELEGEDEIALRGARQLVGEMKSLCDEQGIAFLCVYLPAMCEMDSDFDRERMDRLFGTLAIDRKILDAQSRLGDRLLAKLVADGIATLDLREVFEGQPGPLYWRFDHHLNVEGHRLTEQALRPLVLEAAAGRERARAAR